MLRRATATAGMTTMAEPMSGKEILAYLEGHRAEIVAEMSDEVYSQHPIMVAIEERTRRLAEEWATRPFASPEGGIDDG